MQCRISRMNYHNVLETFDQHSNVSQNRTHSLNHSALKANWSDSLIMKITGKRISICAHIHSDTGNITGDEQASNTEDGLDKSNCHLSRKQKTALPPPVSPIKHKPKQKHTAELAAFMSKSNRNSISLWWGSLKGTPSCQASFRPVRRELANKHNPY